MPPESRTSAKTEGPADRDGYVVLARRYRPQTFADVVGQEQVMKALSNAIRTNRVAHAYLFTGARGVGKTSTARILAKALNCQRGTSIEPCNVCDVCQAVSTGEDIDVLEIDGASNRGIDEMRELRHNAGVRPSRSPYKIYIIDEVHMLTTPAFNALLKTLEEPPEHVKFIFCTTEADKIPITILSRCQRFDFSGIAVDSISTRLEQIVKAEGGKIEPAALAALARRAAGSMRDSQSLLDQLLAFSGKNVTAADMNAMLGTADDAQVGQLVTDIVQRNSAGVLEHLDAALTEGVDIGQLLDQLLGYLRDVMVIAAGGSEKSLLFSSPTEQPRVLSAGKQLGIETVLAVMQILAETKSRLRYSTQGRILTEIALVRTCRLEDLDELPRLIAQLRGAAPTGPGSNPPAPRVAVSRNTTVSPVRVASPATESGATQSVQEVQHLHDGDFKAPSATDAREESDVKKNAESPAEPLDEPHSEGEVPQVRIKLTPESALDIWKQVLASVEDIASHHASQFEQIAISAPNRLVVSFPHQYTFHKTYCQRRADQFETVLAQLTGEKVQIEFALLESSGPMPKTASPEPVASGKQQRMAELAENPLVRRAAALFGARCVGHDESAAQ